MSSEVRSAFGHVFWLFGLSGAGKSTLAGRLTNTLRADGTPVLELDGDTLRKGLCAGLGYSDADRAENLRRGAECARLGVASGLYVVAAFITPLQAHRDLVAKLIGRSHVSLIYLDAPFAVCRKRDPKGLYAEAEAGRIRDMTGVNSNFEPPDQPELCISTAKDDVDRSSAVLCSYAAALLERHRLGQPLPIRRLE